MRGAAILIAFLLTPAVAGAQSDDEGWLTRLLELALSDAGRVIDITGFRGALSSVATMERMTIADGDGIWLTVDNAVLSIDRGAILGGRIEIGRLTAERVVLDRLPASAPAAMTPEAWNFTLPVLPVSVNIDRIGAGRVELGPAIAGDPLTLAVEGDLELEGGAGRANLGIDRVGGPDGRFALSASFDNESRELIFDLDLAEAEGGLAATYLELPGLPSVALGISGAGPPDDFLAVIDLRSGGAERLAGTVALGVNDDSMRVVSLGLGGGLAPMFAPEYRDFFGDDLTLDVRAIAHPEGRIEVERMRLRAAQVAIDGTLSLAEDRLPDAFALVIDISAGDDGVRLPTPGEPVEVASARLTARFDGTEGDGWRLSGRVGGLATGLVDVETLDMEIDGTIRRGGGAGDGTSGIAADVALTAAGVDFGDAALERAFGREMDLTGLVAWSRGSRLRLTDMVLSAGGLDLAGSAALGGFASGYGADLDLRLDTPDLSRLEGLVGAPLEGGISADLVGSFALLTGAFDLILEATAGDLSIRNPSVDPLLLGESRLRVDAARTTDGVELRDFSIETAAISARAGGSVATGRSDLTFQMSLDDLGRFVPALSGPAEIGGEAAERAAGWVVTANLAAPDGLRGASTVTIPNDGGPVLLDNLSMAARGAKLNGRARLNRGAEDRSARVEARIDVPRLSRFVDIAGLGVAGSLEADMVLVTDAAGYSPEVELNGTAVDLSFGIQALDGLLAGRRNIGMEAGFPGDGVVELRRSAVSGDGVELTATGRLAEEDTDLDVFLELDELARLDGRFSGRVGVSANLRRDADGWWTLARADAPGGVGLTVDASASPDLKDIDILSFRLSAPEAEATGGAELRLGGADPAVNARVDVDARDLGVWAGVLGRDLSGSISARFSVDASLDGSRFSVDADGGGESIGIGMSTVDELLTGTSAFSVSIERDADSIRVDSASLRGEAVDARASGRFAGDDTFFDFTARLDRLSRFLPNVPGPLTMAGTARGRKDGWDLNADADGPDGSRFSVKASIPSTGEFSASISGRMGFFGRLVPELPGAATLGFSVDRVGGNLLVGGGAEGPGGARIRLDGEIADDFSDADLSAEGVVPLELMNAWIAPRVVRGTGDFDLRMNGPPALSSVTGTVVTSEARLALPTLGYSVTGIDGRMTLSDRRAFLDLGGTVNTGGRMELTGSMDLAPVVSTDLTLSLKEVVLRDPRLYDAATNGELSVTGPFSGDGLISGEIVADRVDVRIPGGSFGNRGIIPDIIHIDPSPEVLSTRTHAQLEVDQGPRRERTSRGMRLDLRLVAEERIFVSGRGLNAELGGEILLSGTAYRMVPSGRFEMIRGRFNILTQRLDLSEGSARMEGEFIPLLRFVADTDVDGTAIRATVDGPANGLEISFTSTPDLPEEEIMSRLLFGRALSDLSPIQAAQLANAITALSGRGQSGLLDPVRAAARIDNLDLIGDEEGNVGLRVGKYLDDYFYTGVTIGTDQSPEIDLNLDVTPSLTARTGVETQGGASFGLFFEKDY